MSTIQLERDVEETEFESVLKYTISERGYDLDTLSREGPALVVFLRHLGCTFCREALADIARARKAIESAGVRLVLVHMGPLKEASALFPRYGLDDLPRFCDPERLLYKAFGLQRASLRQALGPRVWIRAFQAGLLDRHGFHRVVGNAFQMPGVFVVRDGKMTQSYLHKTVADRPEYLDMAAEECTR